MLIAVLSLSACNDEKAFEVEGCPGRVTRSGAEFIAHDDAFCRFVSWNSRCGSTPQCPVEQPGLVARFERTHWPLHLEMPDGPIDVALRAHGATCREPCVVPIPVGQTQTIEAIAPVGLVPVFTGDCEPSGRFCSVRGDAERTVRISTAEDTVRLVISVTGGGQLSVGGQNCDGACEVRVRRGTSIAVIATPQPGHVLQRWSRELCAGNECQFQILTDDFIGAEFVPLRTLRLDALRSGAVVVNGAELRLPQTLSFASGTTVRLKARPDPDDVLLDIAGLPCVTPRVIDECVLTLERDITGQLVFHRFHAWARGGWAGLNLGNLLERDGGVLVAASTDDAVPELGIPVRTGISIALLSVTDDAGVSVLSQGQSGLARPLLLSRQDTSWVVGTTSTAPAAATIRWGAIDAGVPARSQLTAETLAVRLDPQLQAAELRVLSLAPSDGVAILHTARGPPVATETGFLTPLVWSGPYDGGVQEQSGLAIWDTDFNLVGFREVQTARAVDIARLGTSTFMLSRAESTVGCGLSPTADDVLALSRVDDSGGCLAATIAARKGGATTPYDFGAMARGGDEPIMLVREQSNTTFAEQLSVRAFDRSLAPRWTASLIAQPELATNTMYPVDTIEWGPQSVLTLVGVRHDAETVIRASSGVAVRCPAAANAMSLVLLRHARATGEVTWGTCLAARDGSAERFRMGASYRNVLPALGGLLVAPEFRATGPGSMKVGSSDVAVSQFAGFYLMLLTPPE